MCKTLRSQEQNIIITEFKVLAMGLDLLVRLRPRDSSASRWAEKAPPTLHETSDRKQISKTDAETKSLDPVTKSLRHWIQRQQLDQGTAEYDI
jgi:hypothetical protein